MRNKFYLAELEYCDGTNDVIFNIVELNDGEDKITVAITKCGKTSIQTLELKKDKRGVYFEYGVAGQQRIHIDDFEEV